MKKEAEKERQRTIVREMLAQETKREVSDEV